MNRSSRITKETGRKRWHEARAVWAEEAALVKAWPVWRDGFKHRSKAAWQCLGQTNGAGRLLKSMRA